MQKHDCFLSLIREAKLLVEEEGAILASKEDIAYFRNLYTSPKPTLPEPTPQIPPQRVERVVPAAANPTPPKPIAALVPDHKNFKGNLRPDFSAELCAELDGNLHQVVESEHKAGQEKMGQIPENFCGRVLVPNSVSVEKRDLPPPSSSMRNVFLKVQIPFIEPVPEDHFAKKRAERWKTKNQAARLSVLSFNELPAQKAFLQEIAFALDVYFEDAAWIDASGIEKEKDWETFLSSPKLKLVIMSDASLWQLPSLLKLYRENPTLQKKTVMSTPLFLLPDLSLYLKDPLLKRSLWRALCQTIAT